MDLFDFARDRDVKPVSSQPPTWAEPGTTLWGRAWLEHVHRLCSTKYASELAFGEKLLSAGRMQACRVRGAHTQATFSNREGGTALVNLAVKPLAPERWLAVERLCDRCGDALFSSDDLPDDVIAELFGRPGGLLPDLHDLTFSCSHCHLPFCLYRGAALLAMATVFDQKPIKLLELRGAARDLLFTRAAQQAADGDAQLADTDLAELFGIDLA